jgi:tetratricopeptide (TPR) repeat protein
VTTAAIVLALVLGATPIAAPTPPPTREQALADVDKGDVEKRRQAVAALGEMGAMADTPVLVRALRDDDELVRALAEQSLWRVWSRSGDAKVDALFEEGVEQMQMGAAADAIRTFTAIIQMKPDFAEGWNKRATIYYLVGEYEKSLHDCDEVMKRNPSHFGALSGYGQIYLQLDKPEQALVYFERALKVNPNLHGVESAVEDLRRLMIETRKGTI